MEPPEFTVPGTAVYASSAGRHLAGRVLRCKVHVHADRLLYEVTILNDSRKGGFGGVSRATLPPVDAEGLSPTGLTVLSVERRAVAR